MTPFALLNDTHPIGYMEAGLFHQEFVESLSASFLFLPAYSPDFNPIEKMWSKIKQILRALQARTREELFDAIAKALNMVTAVDAQGWFASCGYVKYQS